MAVTREYGTPNQLTGIKQRVYLPVPREYKYSSSFCAKHLSGPTKLTLSIRSHTTEKVLAPASVDGTSPDWTKCTIKLDVQRASLRRLEAVAFAVSVDGDERVDVDQISLMPDDAVDTFVSGRSPYGRRHGHDGNLDSAETSAGGG